MPERVRRLTKRDVEALLAAIDGDDLVGAVARALRSLLAEGPGGPDGPDMSPRLERADWTALVRRAGVVGGWDAARINALVAEDRLSLEALAIELNELRTL